MGAPARSAAAREPTGPPLSRLLLSPSDSPLSGRRPGLEHTRFHGPLGAGSIVSRAPPADSRSPGEQQGQVGAPRGLRALLRRWDLTPLDPRPSGSAAVRPPLKAGAPHAAVGRAPQGPAPRGPLHWNSGSPVVGGARHTHSPAAGTSLGAAAAASRLSHYACNVRSAPLRFSHSAILGRLAAAAALADRRFPPLEAARPRHRQQVRRCCGPLSTFAVRDSLKECYF